ncbi:hypothetical protein DK867_14250 [Ochrobactrum sp. POC9]|uniref:hypothetical protein n=1 Tax=Ochrobactrum sp. POC9 TaxID=2203419 RepID=UPI000D708C91|nr:hypothetical protein [Ochrobactrum sp. POC9]PWU72384.1 hypothetical protein DK867_14250 [Ochrobactrum sp. POC9]
MNTPDLKELIVATDEENDTYTLRVDDNFEIAVARKRVDQPDGSIIVEETDEHKSFKMFFQ